MRKISAFDDILSNTILLSDLALGTVIRASSEGAWGVQVYGEPDMRLVRGGNLWTDGKRLIEILPSYSDDELRKIFDKLNSMEDGDMARTIIALLELAGFQIDYEDYRTVQDGFSYKFFYNPPPSDDGRLIIKAIGHKPTFCNRYGHQWAYWEVNLLDEICEVCSHCGTRRLVQEHGSRCAGGAAF